MPYSQIIEKGEKKANGEGAKLYETGARVISLQNSL